MDHSVSLEDVEARHKKEKKELQAQIQGLKKTAKNDKSKKKELTAEIARLESEMEIRHKEELDAFEQMEPSESETVTGAVQEVDNVKFKISKAQKRRDKKSQQEKERAENIRIQEKENLHGPRNLEIQTISAKLKEKKLRIFAIPSDGDCLYQAISHQLAITRAQQSSVGQLRQQVAEYIRENKEDFMPFMSNSDSGDMLTDNEFNKYCDDISNTKVWGGQLEIRALSNSLKCPITIIQATGPGTIEQGMEFDGPPLVVTYHRHMYKLGEHYNSTQILNEEDEDQS